MLYVWAIQKGCFRRQPVIAEVQKDDVLGTSGFVSIIWMRELERDGRNRASTAKHADQAMCPGAWSKAPEADLRAHISSGDAEIYGCAKYPRHYALLAA